jgi:hypothetical protein
MVKKKHDSSVRDRIEVKVNKNVNNVRRGDVLVVDDTPAARALIANGYYSIVERVVEPDPVVVEALDAIDEAGD